MRSTTRKTLEAVSSCNQHKVKPGQLKGGDIVTNPEQAEHACKLHGEARQNEVRSGVFEHTFVLPKTESLAVIEAIVKRHANEDYYVYENPASGQWQIALGMQAALVVTPTQVTQLHIDKPSLTEPLTQPISELARNFVKAHGGHGWHTFGQAAFEYAAHIHGVLITEQASEKNWPLLSLMVPYSEITLNHQHVTIRTRDITTLGKLQTLLAKEKHALGEYGVSAIDTRGGQAAHQQAAEAVLDVIHSGRCEKVTLSRQVAVPKRINMLGTFVQSRPIHTPSRSFLVKFMGREAMGFSPELIVAVNGQTVLTEPVAGTRALHSAMADNAQLRRDLHSDPKEIVEHAISVREAVTEMSSFSHSVTVDKFMATLERGSVQHLGSEVSGTLSAGKDAWHAFDELFPSITASGIPKAESIEAILHIETESRGLYSGAILMLDEHNFEACLVLRSAFQDADKSWIQAGCGMVGLSTPEREFIETIEKFAGIAPYVVCEQ